MKKYLAMLLCILLCLPCAFAEREAPEREKLTSGDYTYVLLDDGTAEIWRYNGKGGAIEIPSDFDGHVVTTIGAWAFEGSFPTSQGASLTSVTIPDSVTSIGEHAFAGCDNLVSVTIPDSVTEIGKWAFGGCDSLTSVTIPDSVMTVGENPFLMCAVLVDINVSPDHPTLETIDGVLFSKADKRLVCYPYAFTDTTYDIPQGIEIIGGRAFSSCRSLTSVTIPDSVTEIGECAFILCESLTSVTIPDSVMTIGNEAFAGCYNLTSVTITDGVTTIGIEAFGGCGLTSITIPGSVTSIGENAFSGCDSLTTVTITDGVTTIGIGAFSGCYNLTSVTIPDSVTMIDYAAFADCGDNLIVAVRRDSYAEEYCIENQLKYVYFDDNDGQKRTTGPMPG